MGKNKKDITQRIKEAKVGRFTLFTGHEGP
jgi:hypothetical protein